MIQKIRYEQINLSKNIILKDEKDINSVSTAAGVHQLITGKSIISAIVVCSFKTMEEIEKCHSSGQLNMGYLSGFRAYREGAAIASAYAKLSAKPDILFFYGNGILHPRNVGIASHMGLLLDQASIGVAKSLACGAVEGDKVKLDNKIVGQIVETKKHSKPVYVSPGHKISLKTSVEIVRKCIRPPHKLPEPLHLALRYSKRLAKEQ